MILNKKLYVISIGKVQHYGDDIF